MTHKNHNEYVEHVATPALAGLIAMSVGPDNGSALKQTPSAAQLVFPGKADFWHEDDGSLRFVARIVRRPCCAIWSVLAVALLMSFIAAKTFASFDEGKHDYDLADPMATKFDSLMLASKMLSDPDVEDDRRLSRSEFSLPSLHDPSALKHFEEISPSARALVDQVQSALQPNALADFPHRAALARVLGEQPKRRTLVADTEHTEPSNSEQFAPLLVTYEAAVDNIFTPSILAKMKATEDIVRKNADYGKFCFKSHGEIGDPTNNCTKPLSAINILYASEWDTAAVARVQAALDTPEKITTFNQIGLCFAIEGALEFPYCQGAKASVAEDLWNATRSIGTDLNSITEKWDGLGDVIPTGNTQADIDEILTFCLLLKENLPLYGWKVREHKRTLGDKLIDPPSRLLPASFPPPSLLPPSTGGLLLR
jgi:hypothetical protein